MITATQSVRIDDPSQVGEARRAAVSLATIAGFDETRVGKIAVVVTEAASNIIRHAGGGEVLLRPIDGGLEMLAMDKGPGIANLNLAMEDRHSTAGSQGIGLGAIVRMASLVDIYTVTGGGTVILARFHSRAPSSDAIERLSALEIGAAQSAYPGEDVCGDAWGCAGQSIFLADGLGHGTHAAAAAETAVSAFAENWRLPAPQAIEAVHFALRSTRGAAVALTCVDFNFRQVRFCGLGNISGAIVCDGESRSMVSHNGTAGHQFFRIAQFDYAWPEASLIILHSDGIGSKWNLQSYPGLEQRDPSLIAGVLYRDFRRQRDDATILVIKARRQVRNGAAH